MDDLVITSAAERDYTEALTWYAERSQAAAEGFEREFQRTLELISRNPTIYPLCDERHRFCLMRHYPFQVIYRMQGSAIAIIAVAHTKRDPGYWTGR